MKFGQISGRGQAAGLCSPAAPPGLPRIGYILLRYPVVSQLFVLREMLQLEALGVPLAVFSLYPPETTPVRHPEAQQLRAPVSYLRGDRHVVIQTLQTVSAHVLCLLTNPRGYARSVRFLLTRRTLFQQFRQAARVAVLARRAGLTHFHAHFAGQTTCVALFASMLSDIPYSFTAHAQDIFVAGQFLADKIRRAQNVIVISQYNQRHMASLCGAETDDLMRKVHVVYLGVPVEDFATLHRDSARVSLPHEPVVLTVARLARTKGHEYLIDALARLRDRGQAFRWVVAGQGEEEQALRERVREMRLVDRVEFRGAVNSEQVSQLLAKATLFVLPSVPCADGDMDGIPVALMEAMAAGLPVISTTISGIPELIEDGTSGLLVPPLDSAALADAIQSVLTDEDQYRRLAAGARRRIAESFDLAQNVRLLADLFGVARR